MSYLLKKKGFETEYAIKADSLRPVHVSEVERGLACNCVCACGRRMVANQGDKKRHYFSHEASESHGKSCGNPNTAHETMLHLRTKELIAKNKKIIFPGYYIRLNKRYKDQFEYKTFECFDEAKITFDSVELEKKQEEGLIPDCVGYLNGQRIYLEVHVSHKVPEEKIVRIKDEGVSAIEINLKDFQRDPTDDELMEAILNKDKLQWLHYEKEYEFADKAEEFFRNQEVGFERRIQLEEQRERERLERERQWKLEQERQERIRREEEEARREREIENYQWGLVDEAVNNWSKKKSKEKVALKIKEMDELLGDLDLGYMFYELDMKVKELDGSDHYFTKAVIEGLRSTIDNIKWSKEASIQKQMALQYTANLRSMGLDKIMFDEQVANDLAEHGSDELRRYLGWF